MIVNHAFPWWTTTLYFTQYPCTDLNFLHFLMSFYFSSFIQICFFFSLSFLFLQGPLVQVKACFFCVFLLINCLHFFYLVLFCFNYVFVCFACLSWDQIPNLLYLLTRVCSSTCTVRPPKLSFQTNSRIGLFIFHTLIFSCKTLVTNISI